MPPPGLCAKCRSWSPITGDTCTALAELNRELERPWDTAYRKIAHDLIISVTRQLKALRNLSTGVRSQISSEASRRSATAGEERKQSSQATPGKGEGAEDTRGEIPRRRTTSAKQLAAPKEERARKRAATEVESEETEEDSESDLPDTVHKPLGGDPDRKPPEPDHPPPGQRARAPSSHREKQQHLSKDTPRDRERHSRHSKHRNPRHRAGRKHQRLYRLLENPSRLVHQRQAESFWALKEEVGEPILSS